MYYNRFLLGEVPMPVIDENIFSGIQKKSAVESIVGNVNLNKQVRSLFNVTNDTVVYNLTKDYEVITVNSVKEFQIVYNANYSDQLAVDGIIGPKTSIAMFRLAKDENIFTIDGMRKAIKDYVDKLNADAKEKDIVEEIKEDKKESFLNKYGSYAILGISGFAVFVLIMSLIQPKKEGRVK